MDAFVRRQLFASDVVLVVAQPSDSDVAQELQTLVETHGGVVLEQLAQDEARDVKFLLLPGIQDAEMLNRLTTQGRELLQAKWVHDSVQQNRRLATAAYRVIEAAEEEPPAKKRKVADLFAVQGAKDAALPQPFIRPWKTVQNSLLVLDARAKQPQETQKAKIASFDLDGTLIVTKSGKKFAKDISDWKWFHPSLVREKLAELARNGFTLTIFSNQNGVAKGHSTVAQVQSKLAAIVTALDLPMLVFLGTENDVMRKPRLGAWDELKKMLSENGEDIIDKKASFYCGDAAGRPKITGRAKDFAATDYKFALNAGIRFCTPEDLFLGSKQRIHTRPDTWELGFDPKSIIVNDSAEPSLIPASAETTKSEQEIVVLVGPPASGKSFFAKTFFNSYVLVSQDELRTATNCKKKCLEAIAKKKSVVVDNTNRDPRARKEWISIAQEKNLPIRCFQLDVDKPLSMHLNTFRSLTEQKKIPDVAIHGFYKNLVPPTVNEGFEEVVKVQFRIDKTSSNAHKALLQSYI